MASAVEDLSICLEHDIDEQYQYQPGEVLRGTVVVKLSRNTTVEKVYITIHGEGAVAWEDPDYGNFNANEVYISATKTVMEESRPTVLNTGTHEFLFEYELPSNLPSSFIGKFGSVTYVIKGCVQCERHKGTSITSEPFLILRQTHLAEELGKSAETSAEKRIWGMCTVGKVKTKVTVSKTGGVPGEDLFIHAEVANKSPARVTAVQASIVMNSLYHAQKKAIPFRQIVNKRRDEYELLQGDGRRWQNVRLTIPPYIPESRLDFCDIIEITYSFQFRVEISGGKEIKLEVPLMIGSVGPADSPGIDRMNSKTMEGGWSSFGFESSSVNFENSQNWHGGHVPELRHADSAVVVNPLFQNGSQFERKKEAPEEIIESTKL